MTTSERVKEIAAVYGLEGAPWIFDFYPATHQKCVIIGQFVHGKPIVEAVQYDGVNFYGWLGGRHNSNVWAWLDADTAYALLMSREGAPVQEIPHLRASYRPGHP